jgi:uncharacterized protein (UPF0248 family)
MPASSRVSSTIIFRARPFRPDRLRSTIAIPPFATRPAGPPVLPIHKLLHRIRWDPRFRRGRFVLGYFDRVARRVVLVPFETIRFPADAPGTFEIQDEDGVLRRIPLHRVRRLYRDQRLIWQRRTPGD